MWPINALSDEPLLARVFWLLGAGAFVAAILLSGYQGGLELWGGIGSVLTGCGYLVGQDGRARLLLVAGMWITGVALCLSHVAAITGHRTSIGNSINFLGSSLGAFGAVLIVLGVIIRIADTQP